MLKRLKELWQEYEMDKYYSCGNEGHTFTLRDKIRWWWMVLVGQWWKERHCRKHGHDWVDESYGGPDSGGMAGHCQRCGYSFHRQLY